MEFNTTGIDNCQHMYAQIASIFAAATPGIDMVTFADRNDQYKGEWLINYFRELSSELGLPATLEAARVREEDLEMLAEEAMLQQRLLINNPKTVGYEDALGIYRKAFR